MRQLYELLIPKNCSPINQLSPPVCVPVTLAKTVSYYKWCVFENSTLRILQDYQYPVGWVDFALLSHFMRFQGVRVPLGTIGEIRIYFCQKTI